jgi:uncharacterized phage infection (PIP) family protein YhgE
MSLPEPAPSRSSSSSIGILVSLLWVVAFAIYVQAQVGWTALADMPPGELGGLLAGFTAPLALLWLLLSTLRRGFAGAQHHAGALEDEVRRLSLPLSETEAKTMRIADAMRRQVETLNAASANAQSRLQATADALDAQSKRIAEVAEQLVHEVERAKQRLAGEAKTLEDRIGAVALGLRGEVGQLEVAIAEAGQRLEAQAAGFGDKVEATRKAFAQPTADLAAIADRMAEQPAAFAKVTREHADVLLGAAGKAVDEMETQIRARALAMDNLFDNLVSRGERVQEQMLNHLSDLTRSASEAGEAANEVGRLLERRSEEFAQSFEDHSRTLGVVLARQHENLGSQLQQQSENLMREMTARGAETLRELRRETEQVIDGFGAMERASQGLRESLKTQSAESTTVADRIAREAQAIVTSFRTETDALAGAMSHASVDAGALAAALRRQVEEILRTTGEATSSVTILQGDIGQRLQQLSAETDAVATRALGVAETYRQHSL